MKLTVDIQNACEQAVPEEDDIRSWIEAALTPYREEAEVSVRLVDEAEMAALNQTYRDRQGPTNVLSFPTDLPDDIPQTHLGDIVVCAPVVSREAMEQQKPEQAHWTHMLVHGSLHLLGYDHIGEHEADVMEALETTIMNTLGLPCPYQGDTASASIRSME